MRVGTKDTREIYYVTTTHRAESHEQVNISLVLSLVLSTQYLVLNTQQRTHNSQLPSD